MLPLDRYALTLVARIHARVQRAYTDFEFHRAFHALHTMCGTELSAFYLDIVKDRLYVSAADSPERRSAQTALWQITLTLLCDVAPILSFTAEEAFGHLPEAIHPGLKTVFALRFALDERYLLDEETRHRWDTVAAVRAEITKAIEPARKAGTVGHSLDTHVTVHAREELLDDLRAQGVDLAEICIVSKVGLAALETAPDDAWTSQEVQGLRVAVAPAPGAKCERCWKYSEELGSTPEHPGLCPRCAGVMLREGAPEDGRG
jgi:isoleucyl-tRNA synthetase